LVVVIAVYQYVILRNNKRPTPCHPVRILAFGVGFSVLGLVFRILDFRF